MDINEELKKQREQIAKLTRDLENSTQELNAAKDYYENIIALMPGHVYWMDKNNVFLGCNDLQAKAAKLSSRKEIIGKRNTDMLWKNQATTLDALNLKVMQSGKPYVAEEYAVMGSGAGTYLSHKVPLFNEKKEVIGLVGISLDITAQKEAEKLKLESAANKAQLAVQSQMSKMASQVAHDIRSPLSSLLIIIKHCHNLPEKERIALREAARSISDIANHLLSRYKKDESEISIQEERNPMLLSAVILQLLADKRFQYKELSVQFEDHFSPAAQFAFIHVESSSFKRMMSNLINNAVDALEDKFGVVTLKLDASAETVKVTVGDDGKGMPPHIVDKIMQNIAFTEEKSNGHGIGLAQVRETLARNEGKMSIQSAPEKGTEITLEFPRIETPEWVAEDIKLGAHDTVIILDDDSSIHRAWDAHFESILRKSPNITVKHFEICHDALDFIDQFAKEAKQEIYLLTDYELLRQKLNGLDVIERSDIKRSILVTSHYADPIVLDLVEKMGTKILPKQLASEIPIYVDKK